LSKTLAGSANHVSRAGGGAWRYVAHGVWNRGWSDAKTGQRAGEIESRGVSGGNQMSIDFVRSDLAKRGWRIHSGKNGANEDLVAFHGCTSSEVQAYTGFM